MKKIGMRYLTLGNIFGQFAKSFAILFMVALIGCTSSSTDDSDDNTPPQEQPSNPDDGDDNSGGGSGSSNNNEQISMEELVANVESAQEVIDPLFEQCETIDDLAKHLDEIKAMECVSNAWIYEDALYTIVEGGFQMGWSYHTIPTLQDNTTSANNNLYSPSDFITRASNTEQRDEHTFLEGNNVCIINQVFNDSDWAYIRTLFSNLEQNFTDADFAVRHLRGTGTTSFILNQLSNYNIIFWATHGCYDGDNHWFTTESISTSKDTVFDYLESWIKYGFLDAAMYLSTTYDGKHIMIADELIDNQMGNLKDAIVFCSSCESLKGNNRVAEIFLNKGAKVFLGYTDTTCVSNDAGVEFFKNMLKGMTTEQAYNKLDGKYRIDNHPNHPKKPHNAKLVLHGDKDYCIVHPKVKTIEKPEVEGASATLEGVVEEWNGNKLLEGTVGFCWSKSEDCKEPTIENDFTDVLDISNSDQEEIEFDTTIEDLEIATEYYYRSYLYINDEYWYGEVKKFNTSNLPTVSTLGADADGLSATLKGITENWHENFSGSVGFCWSKDTANPTIEDDHISVINVSNSSENEIEFDATIEDLEFNTRYYYCAYLHINGEYYYGDVKTVNTAKLPTISTLNADVDGLSATLKGVTENWHEDFSGSVGFCWSTESSSPSIEDENIHVLSINKSGETSINFLTTLENLEQAKQYYYRAYLCIDNTYYYGEIKVFETSTLPIVTTLDAEIHGRDVKLKAEVKNWHTDYDGYVGFCWSKDNTNPTINDEKHLIDISAYDYTNLIASATIPDLDYNTIYYYRAFLYINGEYIYSEVNTFKIEVTPTITTLDAEINDYSVTLTALVNNWYEDLDGSVGICWSKDNTEPTINDEKHVVYLKYLDYTDFTTSKTIEDLDIKTKYYYRAFLKIKDEYLYGEVKTFIIEDPEAYFREYLIKLYNDTNGNNWESNYNWCSDKPLTTWAHISKNSDGSYKLNLRDNLSGSIDLSGCITPFSLYTNSDNINSINLSGCVNLKKLDCSYCDNLSELTISGCTALKELDCSYSNLKKLDVSNCTALQRLTSTNVGNPYCLTSINASGCSTLEYLECYDNVLTTLNVSGCIALKAINCSYNLFSSLDFSGCSALESITCMMNWDENYNRTLKNINLEGCTSLKKLYCSMNALSNLNLSSCSELEELDCSGNRITAQITKQLHNIKFFYYDRLYTYIYDYWTKNDYGWYYPGEPSERGHEPPTGW